MHPLGHELLSDHHWVEDWLLGGSKETIVAESHEATCHCGGHLGNPLGASSALIDKHLGHFLLFFLWNVFHGFVEFLDVLHVVFVAFLSGYGVEPIVLRWEVDSVVLVLELLGVVVLEDASEEGVEGEEEQKDAEAESDEVGDESFGRKCFWEEVHPAERAECVEDASEEDELSHGHVD
jgi:hypothetical protein